MISKTWQFTLNDLLQEWLHYSFIRKRERILLKNIKKLQRKEKNKMNNLKYWKSKNISSNKQIFREIQWQVEIFKNKAEKEISKTDKNYIIMMRTKNYLQSETDNTTICIDEKFRKVSQIKKVKKKISSRTVTECIRNINRSINTNWAKFRKKQFRKSIH